MSDDIETIREFLRCVVGQTVNGRALGARAFAALERLEHSHRALQAISVGVSSFVPIAESLKANATVGSLIDWVKAQIVDRDALRKALDDRYEADKNAAKAIFRATGRTKGFPDNKEVVAFYVAEVERLKGEIARLRSVLAKDDHTVMIAFEDGDHQRLSRGVGKLQRENDSLRAKLDDAIAELCSKDPNFTPIFDSYAAENQRLFDAVEALRAKLDRAKEALEPFAEAEKTMMRSLGKTADDHLYGVYAFDLRRARAVLSELSADAPAQERQVWPNMSSSVPGEEPDGLADAPAQLTQTSDEAVEDNYSGA